MVNCSKIGNFDIECPNKDAKLAYFSYNDILDTHLIKG